MTSTDERRAAKVEAAAAKARAKAVRPWFKKKRIVLPLALMTLILVFGVIGNGGEDAPTADSDRVGTATQDQEAVAEDSDDAAAVPAEEPSAEPAPDDEAASSAGIGQPASDGAFTFTVASVECGQSIVGEEPFAEEAQGQFCLLSVRVENTGDSAQSLFADNQLLLNTDGTQYSASSQATFANDVDGNTLFTEINPGNAVEGVIVFDVPEAAQIATAELHDSAFSGGVEVNLGG